MTRSQRIAWTAAAGLALIAIGVLACVVVVPQVIESAYHGRSLSWLNGLITDRASYPLEHYLTRWREAWQGALVLALVVALLPLPLLAHRLPIWPGGREPRVLSSLAGHALIALLLIAGLVWVYTTRPAWVVYLTCEDHLAEYGSFVAFGMVGVLLMADMCRAPRQARLFPMILAVASLLVAIEEISWGQRIVGFGTPAAFVGRNVQSELTLHNLEGVHALGASTMLPLLLLVGWVVLLPAASRRWEVVRRCRDRLGVPSVPAALMPLALLAMLILLRPYVAGLDEIRELLLGLLLAVVVVHAIGSRSCPARALAPRALVTTVLLLHVGVLAALLVAYRSDPDALRWDLHQAATNHFPDAGMHRQALMVFDHIDRHPELAMPETGLEHGHLLLTLGEEERAREVLDRAVAARSRAAEDDPRDAAPLRNLGEVLLLLGRASEAEQALRGAIARDLERIDTATTTEERVLAKQSLAGTHFVRGDFAASIAELESAIELTGQARMALVLERQLREVRSHAARSLAIERSAAAPGRSAPAVPSEPAS